MNTQRLVIVDGVRTPFCKAGTDLSHKGPDELGRTAVNALLTRTGLDPALVDEVIFGCVSQPADAANVARVIALRSGIPESVPAMTVHRNCASGCEALTQAAEKISAGHGSIFIVGGTESMSQVPLLFKQSTAEKFGRLARSKSFGQKIRTLASFRPSDFQPRIGLQLGLTDPVCGLNMGETAEVLAREFGISREEQDAFALESHRRATAANARLAEEICPIYVNGHKPAAAILQDNGPRPNQSPEALAKLKPVFDRRTGTVTAGNASQITDGAVALLVMSEEKASLLGLRPLGALAAYTYAGCDPARMGLGPVFAMAKLEEESGLDPTKADLIEINEAFAAQLLAVLKGAASTDFARKHLGRDRALGEIAREKLNVNGGAIALGHPVGATGARLILTSLKELRRRNAKHALVSACVGGGQGVALLLEAL
ncbi:MAG TPA: thiolase family protein [Candidatus Polarisedimenticolia bacterium]|nr:thiolase family protein [Candidatus Polarisedimenticolia bacterium]